MTCRILGPVVGCKSQERAGAFLRSFSSCVSAVVNGIGSGFQLVIQSIDGIYDGKKAP
jgi:hypothetical protein